jgi:hypothetical protein
MPTKEESAEAIIEAAIAERVVDRKTIDDMTREGATQDYIVRFIEQVREEDAELRGIESAMDAWDREDRETEARIKKLHDQIDEIELSVSSPLTRPIKRTWYSVRDKLGIPYGFFYRFRRK